MPTRPGLGQRNSAADRGRYEGLDTIGAMERSFEFYMTHHRIEGMPADANITENVIKQSRVAAWGRG